MFAFVFALSYVTFYAIKKTYGLRVTAEEEDAGLDISEHGMYGYPEQFIPAPELIGYSPAPGGVPSRETPRGAHHQGGSGHMKKIEAFIRHESFEPIRMELLSLGFPSLSISEVKGSGRQKGITERYRGAELTNWLRPKVKLECVVATQDVQTVVDAILKHARTGPDRRRQGVRHAGRGGLPDPHRRVRRGDAAGPSRGGGPGHGLSASAYDGGRPDISPPAATSLVERLRAVHLQMLDAVLTGDGLAAVAGLAADAAGGPVVVVVPRLGVAVASAGGEPALAAVRRYVGEHGRGRVAPVPPDVVAEVPIASGDERIGGVVLLAPGRPEPEAVEFLHLAAVAALTEVAVEEAREEVEENVRGSFLEELRERPDAIDPADVVAPRRPARLRPLAAAPSCCAPSCPPSARGTWWP